MQAMKFYDVKAKRKFTSANYRFVKKRNPKTKRTMTFAVCKAPSGIEAWRIVAAK